MRHNPIIKWLVWACTGCRLYTGAITASVIGAGAGLAGSMLSADAQKDAAKAAQAANDKLTREQIQLAGQARDRSNTYQQPYYNQGTAGQNKLAYLLGTSNIEETPTDTSYNAYRATVTQRQQEIQQQLEAHTAARPSPKNKKAFAAWKKQKDVLVRQGNNQKQILKDGQKSVQFEKWQQSQPGTVKRELPKDASYGSLLAGFDEKYKADGFTEKFAPKEFNFQADPGYQFRKEQGEGALDKRLSAMGLASSGAALKEGMRFNGGLADQTYNDAFGRYQSEKAFDFGVYQDRYNQFNQNRAFDYGTYQDRFNQFNTEKLNKYNMLSAQSGVGQHAADNLSNNENIYGSNVTGAKAAQNQSTQANIADLGNAKSAGFIGAGNAVQGGANSYIGYLGAKQGKASTAQAQRGRGVPGKAAALARRAR